LVLIDLCRVQNTSRKSSNAYNINWNDVQRNNIVNNVDLSRLRASWQNVPYKNKHTQQHHNHAETQDATDIQKKHNFCDFGNPTQWTFQYKLCVLKMHNSSITPLRLSTKLQTCKNSIHLYVGNNRNNIFYHKQVKFYIIIIMYNKEVTTHRNGIIGLKIKKKCPLQCMYCIPI